jgi:hypothetical protein
LDGDGRLDIVAGNWGLNSKLRASPEHPRRLYYGDIDGNGTVETIETSYDPTLNKEVPERGLRAMRTAIPGIQEAWTRYEAYGSAGVAEIFGDRLRAMAVLEVKTPATMAFLNRGSHFEPAMLPKEAQLAPAFGVCVADLDGDGNEDIFLSQNFFAVNPENTRCDAGRGLLLRGNGKGGFGAMSGRESGIAVYGEQRGCAVADYDADGRLDLVVSQNGNATALFHNVGAEAGLRVRLRGPPGNPWAVGAVVRLRFDQEWGPAREVHAGSGYWSVDSPIQVLGKRGEPTHIWVRWPGGKTTMSPLPKGASAVEVDQTGKIEPQRSGTELKKPQRTRRNAEE